MTKDKPLRKQNQATTRPDYRGKFRYRVIFLILRPFVRFLMWLLFNYTPIRYHENEDQAYFILSNHTGSLDPLLLALSFRRPIFFVASDHILRLGLLSRLLDWLVAPIPIVKSKIDLRALRTITHELQQGRTVALFPSGSRSVDGSEEPIPPSTAKFLKALHAPVLLYRLEGGYLSSPRWAKHHRRGQMMGSVIMHFSAEDLENTETEELYRLLNIFLDANPYNPPRNLSIKYRGLALAEYLERVIYLCPACESFASLHSEKHTLSCTCGFRINYAQEGAFAPASWNPEDQLWVNQFPDIHSLYTWQNERTETLLSADIVEEMPADEALFSDQAEWLIRTERAKRNVNLFRGTLSLYKDRLAYVDPKTLAVLSFPLHEIYDMVVIGPQIIQFTHKPTGITYESRNKTPRSAYKYVNLVAHLKNITAISSVQTREGNGTQAK